MGANEDAERLEPACPAGVEPLAINSPTSYISG